MLGHHCPLKLQTPPEPRLQHPPIIQQPHRLQHLSISQQLPRIIIHVDCGLETHSLLDEDFVIVHALGVGVGQDKGNRVGLWVGGVREQEQEEES